MPKNIVVCSDGTGNSGGKKRGTNVWRVFNAVDRYRADVEQITFYDDGVGTDNLRWLRALGGAFGWGLSRNLRQLYTFVVMNYQPGDRLYLFGFSRGAFTVRSLAGMICRCGLLEREKFLDINPGARERALKRILKAYRSSKKLEERGVGQSCEAYQAYVRRELGIHKLPFRVECIPIHFIGVWDTVDAVGLPFDNLKVIDWIWRRFVGRRLWGFHDRKLSRQVTHAYQALALDDERKTFHPNVWDPPDPTGTQVIEQVWFAGVHSNVGGGYAKDSLSLVSLDWMMGKGHRQDLKFLPDTWKEHRAQADAHGRLYDSRTGFGAFYRYAPRNLYEPPSSAPADARRRQVHVHSSVFERIARGTDNYAPKVIHQPPDEPPPVVAKTDAWPFATPQGDDDVA